MTSAPYRWPNDARLALSLVVNVEKGAEYRLYAEGADRPRMMSVGLHLRMIGRPGRIGAPERFLEHVAAHDDVWTTTRRSIAEHFAAAVPAP